MTALASHVTLVARCVGVALLSFLGFNAYLISSKPEWPAPVYLDLARSSRNPQAERNAKATLPFLSCAHSSPSPCSFTGAQNHCLNGWSGGTGTRDRYPHQPCMIHGSPLWPPTGLAHPHWQARGATSALMSLFLPITQSQMSQLQPLLQPSTIGLDNKLQVHYRPQLQSSREVDGDQITLSPVMMEVFGQMNHAITSHFSWELNSVLHIQLHKLLLYEEGGLFVRHRDACEQEGMLATIVVLLPAESRLQGGSLLVYRPAHTSWVPWRKR